jgi:hypothetical protein
MARILLLVDGTTNSLLENILSSFVLLREPVGTDLTATKVNFALWLSVLVQNIKNKNNWERLACLLFAGSG